MEVGQGPQGADVSDGVAAQLEEPQVAQRAQRRHTRDVVAAEVEVLEVGEVFEAGEVRDALASGVKASQRLGLGGGDGGVAVEPQGAGDHLAQGVVGDGDGRGVRLWGAVGGGACTAGAVVWEFGSG